MGSSLRLFRIWGIDVKVHWSFLLILVYGAFLYSGQTNRLTGALYGVVVILLLFVCVLLHEFGHALTAKYFKVNVPHITLLPIGGVAQLERMPRQPLQEFLIAIAGPAVNFVLALLLLPLAVLVIGLTWGADSLLSLLTYAQTRMMTPSLDGLLVYLAVTNIALGLFNLLPAFPMDGGRVLRSLLAMAMPYVRATRIAVTVGRLMAVLMALWGLGGNIMLLLIAFFIYVGGRGELEAVESRYVLKDIRAKDALNREARTIYTSESIDKVVDLVMTTYQADFPVFDLGNNFVGVLTRPRLVAVLRTQGREGRIVDVMIPAQDVPPVGPETTLADVWDKMMEAGSRVVAVKEQGRFLGLITLDDISELIQVVGATKERDERVAAQPTANPTDFSN
ncbi:MAG: site-2 protease family protein [Caldilineaceae bacterium]|nr:site-2 protease family protein [Caldilineaceae bacterium]HRJ40551.1 site-2 protease family protein [Caldilineaceae bacterium]